MSFIKIFEEKIKNPTEKKIRKIPPSNLSNPIDILRASGIKIKECIPSENGYFLTLFKDEDILNILKNFNVKKIDNLIYLIKDK